VSADQLDLFGKAFVPPRGRGRCRECGWHIITQGHAPGCVFITPQDRRALLRAPREPVAGGDSFELNPHGFFVYLLWGDSPTKPLYVGKTTNIFQRLGTHMSDPEKWRLTKRVEVKRCESAIAMNAKEASLIRRYRPPMNNHVPGEPTRPRPATDRAGERKP
jgi:hypothetical protein